jgi:hypothetical protein
MFRFSLRELSVAALAVALGIAWFAEHKRLISAQSQCDALKIQMEEAKHEAEDAKEVEKAVRHWREKDIELISEGLAKHELELFWFCGGNGVYPSISKRSSDSTP